MTEKELILRAKEAMTYAYAPYSEFQVGAALLAKERQSVYGLQYRKCVLRRDQLRGTDGSF